MKSLDDSTESYLESSSHAHVPSLSSSYYYVKEAKKVRIIPKVRATNNKKLTSRPPADEEVGTSGISLMPKSLGRCNPQNNRYRRKHVPLSSRGEQFIKDSHLRDNLIRDFQIRSLSR